MLDISSRHLKFSATSPNIYVDSSWPLSFYGWSAHRKWGNCLAFKVTKGLALMIVCSLREQTVELGEQQEMKLEREAAGQSREYVV